jgi:peptidoglycan/xylan/chitin deacetylase (PgdA/CDA1 family)
MLTRRRLATLLAVPALAQTEKRVVLTFDDAVKTHRTFVAPLLQQLGFQATFFITHRWMDDARFLSWPEIAELHQMGFEIGNHLWTHAGMATPKAAARLEAELSLIEGELKKVNVPKPISFAWCGNAFGPEALAELERLGYQYARRGMQPERPYGEIRVGPAYDPRRHDKLLIPTTGDAYPEWTLEHFDSVLDAAAPGQLVVLQFHGVPDEAHPWVNTPADKFESYMRRLKERGFRGIALRDLAGTAQSVPTDPTRHIRYPAPKDGTLPQPFEKERPLPLLTGRQTRLAPFPAHEHPRAGFFEGAIAPLRGTKAMAFLPWDPDAYVVIDLPEAIFAGRDLLFLAHTHIPSVWDLQNRVLPDRDWKRDGDALVSTWELPSILDFSMQIRPAENNALDMELRVHNKSGEPLTNLRSQVCVMLKRAKGFAGQPQFEKTIARAQIGPHVLAVEWQNCQRTWGNPRCPCIHSDPALPDCRPGDTVTANGRLWFE